MPEWPTNPEWTDLQDINGGNTFSAADGVTYGDFNTMLRNMQYLKNHGGPNIRTMYVSITPSYDAFGPILVYRDDVLVENNSGVIFVSPANKETALQCSKHLQSVEYVDSELVFTFETFPTSSFLSFRHVIIPTSEERIVAVFDACWGGAGDSVTIDSITESDESGGENVIKFSDGSEMTVKNGKDGASVTITGIEESSESGGSNVVTFSNGQTLTVKNGKKGDPVTVTSVEAIGNDGERVTYQMTFSDGSKHDFDTFYGMQGVSVTSVESLGYTDGLPGHGGFITYRMNFSDGTHFDYDVHDGNDGTSVTIDSITESTESGGSNVITFSDNKTLTIKNGKDGAGGGSGVIVVTCDGYDGERGRASIPSTDIKSHIDAGKMVLVLYVGRCYTYLGWNDVSQTAQFGLTAVGDQGEVSTTCVNIDYNGDFTLGYNNQNSGGATYNGEVEVV